MGLRETEIKKIILRLELGKEDNLRALLSEKSMYRCTLYRRHAYIKFGLVFLLQTYKSNNQYASAFKFFDE